MLLHTNIRIATMQASY